MWNTKVRCVNNSGSRWFTKGKIYDIKNGVLIDDVDDQYNPYSPISSTEDLKRLLPKFELVEEELPQPHKSMLKSGMKVVYRNRDVRYVLLETGYLYDSYGALQIGINNFSDDLIPAHNTIDIESGLDIMEIYDGDKLIAKRTEKPKTVSINVQLKCNLAESDIDEIIDSIKKKFRENIEITFI